MNRYLLLAGMFAVGSIPCHAGRLFTLIPGPDLSAPAGSTLTWELESFNSDPALYLQITGVAAASFDASQGFDDSFADFTYPAVSPGTPTEIDPFYSLTWFLSATVGYGFDGNFTITSEYCADDQGNGCGANFDTLVSYSASVSESGTPEPGTLVLLGLGLWGISVKHLRRWSNAYRENPTSRPQVFGADMA